MKLNVTKAYGIKDYAMSAVFFAMPFLLGFDMRGAKSWVPMLLGGGVLAYSLITRYELSAFKLLSFPMHLLLDAGGGLLLALSPWLFGFADKVFIPYVLLGVAELAIALITAYRTPEVRGNITFLKRQVFSNPALRN